MKRKITILGALLVLVLSINAQEKTPGKFKKVQRVMEKAVEQGLSGVSVYINHPKHGIWTGTSGMASLEDQTPLTTDHIFCLASVGKTYAATAAILMQEEGLLNLDAQISEYLPQHIVQGIPHADKVTVRQLMSMTTGFYNYARHPELNELYLEGKMKLDTTSHETMLERYVFNEEPRALPGERYNYSSTNFMLLAMIMDKQLGYPHQEYYEKKIFNKHGFSNTYYRNTPPKNLVSHYGDLTENGELDNLSDITIETTNWFMGDDGVYATATDVGEFMHALNNGQIVNETSWQEMTDWVMEYEDYGLGLMADKNILYRRVIGHSGVAIGATADVYHLPKKNITIALLCNTGKRNGDEKYRKAYNKLRNKLVMKMLL